MYLKDLVGYLDDYLRTREIPDSSLNGLILENSGQVKKVGFAVDFNLSAIEQGVKEGVDLIIFHHGPYWGSPLPITGAMYKRFRKLMENDIAVYVSHLPLDIHPEVGNNAVAVKLLGFEKTEEFGDYHGIKLGRKVTLETPMDLKDFVNLVKERIAEPLKIWDFGKQKIESFAYASGDAISLLPEAVQKEIDLLIVGEPRHYSFSHAKDNRINVIFLGHYESETIGLKALAEHLQNKLNLETAFLPEPTGL